MAKGRQRLGLLLLQNHPQFLQNLDLSPRIESKIDLPALDIIRHLAFYWPERRTMFAGDALATWPGLSLGWPAFNLNRNQHRNSLRKIDHVRADAIAVGHGEPAIGERIDRLRTLIRSGRDH